MTRAAFCFALAAVFAAACFAQNKANAQCIQNAARRNQKDLYADSTDCHNYYQCFYYNETYAIGIQRKCPAGSFWHDAVLSCMPEGVTPCVDRCLDAATSAKACYAGKNCRHFYVCANTGSYGMCCPEGTVFNEATCSCDASDSCHDACVQDAPLVKTTVRPSQQLNATHCLDSWGNIIRIVAGVPNAYFVVGVDGSVHDPQYCPENILFSLDTCRCDIEGTATTPAPAVKRQATLWLTFDTDLNDKSINKFSSFAYDGAQRDTANSAFGGASLAINGGYLSIPGLKSHDFRNAASFCAFFRCSGACSGTGGILSNNKDSTFSDFTVVLAQNGTNAHGRLNLQAPVGPQSTSGALNVPTNGWNHICLIYDSQSIVLHVNGVAGSKQFVGGFIQIGFQSFFVGTDAAYGTFAGNVDDVLITGFALTQAEIDAHRTGDRVYLANRGFF